MIVNEVKIIPTNKVGDEGYKEARMIIDGKEYIIDSFATEGFVSFDFECESGGIKIWNMRSRGLDVTVGYNAFIKAL